MNRKSGLRLLNVKEIRKGRAKELEENESMMIFICLDILNESQV